MSPSPPPPTWESLFDELADLDVGERERRLAALGERDPELARFLAELLAADAARSADQRTLETPIGLRNAGFVARALDVSDASAGTTDRSGERIGAWRLVRPLGRGGMAEVYLAERVDGEFEQRAALKLIRAEVGSESIHRRFLRERRILAQLEHPGIARLLDGGRTAAGEPYFVLELIEGRRITDHCEAAQLPVAERLRLFAEVCDAVDAAHRRLVVHRDLKPSNILVTPEGQVKLLDFGIAKLLDPGRDGGTPIPSGSGPMTRLEAQPLTPSYAAPEQILGEPISTATDVFALGILLYELVAGRPPFERRSDSRGALALEVASETLTSPSAALRRSASAAESPRRDLLKRRAAEIEGDLDTVISKALAREPERRYRSAAELADDVRNHIARRPVRARPDSLRYRAGRFVARHRAAVALAAISALALVALVAIALVQGQLARREARRAERVRSFLVELFREADPSRTRGATLTARELISVGATRVERELAAEPEVAAELFDAIAQVEIGLGLAHAAEGHARSAIALQEAAHGADASPALASRVTLAEALFARGELESAAAAIRDALPLLDRQTEAALLDRLVDLETNILSHFGEREPALARARGALERSVRATGPDGFEALLWTTRVAALLTDGSRVAEAVELLRPKLAALRRERVDHPLRLAELRLTAGEIFDYAGEREVGAALVASAIAQLRETLGAEHPEVALAEIKLGFLELGRRRLDEAEVALAHAARVLDGVGHYEAGAARRYLGLVLVEQGAYSRALSELEAAERIFRERLPGEMTYIRSARLSQGLALLRMDELERAETVLREVIEEFEREEGPTSNSLRTALKYLGETRRLRGDPAEALALHERARVIELAVFGTENHASIAVSDFQIAQDRLALGGPAAIADARARLDRAIAFQRQSEAEHPRLGDFLAVSARLARAEGDVARFRRDAAEALAILRAARGEEHESTRAARRLLDAG